MPELSIWVVLLGFSAMQGFYFAALLLLQKQGNARANRWLVLILTLVAYYLSVETLIVSGLFKFWPHIAGTHWGFWYLLGPLLFIYVRLHLDRNFTFRLWHLIHLIPAAYITVRMIPFYQLDGAVKISILERPTIGSGEMPWQYLLLAAQLLGYLLFALRAASSRKQQASEERNTVALSTLRWSQLLIAAFTGYIVFDTIAGVILHLFELNTKPLVHTTTMVMSIFVHVVAFVSVRHPERIFSDEEKKAVLTEDIKPLTKYRNSALSQQEIGFYLSELNRIMKQERPYLNSELKLSDLANLVGLTPHNLSQVLNQGLSVSFYDYVNNFRIKDVQQRLLDPRYDDLTIFGIALESGFRSKTSFNRMFKRSTGLTPSSYIKNEKFRVQSSEF
ncbi:MAG: helix-turn-helix domain-containing protein [Calditrichota bacterium]